MNLKKLWHNLSYIGIDDRANEFDYREIVLLNKMSIMTALTFLAFIPLEILANDSKLVSVEIILVLLTSVVLGLNYFRYYTFSKYYFFLMAASTLLVLGIGTGKGSANEFFFIPLSIIPLMLFRDVRHILILSVLAVLSFFALRHLQTVVTPFFEIPIETMQTFQPFFLAVVFLLLFLGVYYFKGINNRFQELLATRNKEIKLKNKEIVDSITYAKRIQNAILPPVSLVNQAFSDAFVLYKPKDIIAGDFYWLERSGDLVFLAVADCTGHGVPGAMVSVVCNNALNRAVKEFGLTQPDLILNKTREIVIGQFEKSEEDVKDGMDITLCVFDTTTKELQYSGANNPLWFIKADTDTLQEIKADKQPVGKYIDVRPFTNHSIQLQAGDQVFLFSDGLADQFGGPEGKKYKYKPLKNLLMSISALSMKEQYAIIEKEFLAWKGDLEQVDDVCVVGVRV